LQPLLDQDIFSNLKKLPKIRMAKEIALLELSERPRRRHRHTLTEQAQEQHPSGE
jgi:hypothetical protein